MAIPGENKLQEFRAEALRVAAQLPQIRAAFAPVNFVVPETQAELDRSVADAPGRAARAQENEILLSHGSIDGVQERGQEAAKGIQQRAALARQASEQTRSTAWLLEMLNSGEGLGAFIGERVFGNMTDDEIMAVVTEIELAVSKPFEEYAADILGDEMPERQPGESDADYAERVLVALSNEMIEMGPDDRPRIKDEYKDDPLAAILVRDQTYQTMTSDIGDLKERLNTEGETPAVLAKVAEIASPGVTQSHAIDREVENAAVDEVARESTDGFRNEDSEIAQNDDASGSALAGLNIQFASAASAEEPEVVQTSTNEATTPSRSTGNDPSPV